MVNLKPSRLLRLMMLYDSLRLPLPVANAWNERRERLKPYAESPAPNALHVDGA